MALSSAKLFLFSPLHGRHLQGNWPVWQRKSSMAELDNEELRRLKDVNMDEAPARRHVRDCFKDIQHNLDHILIKTPGDGIKTKESYEVNSRGVEIFSKSWLPEASRPRALVCFCHGIARRLSLSGYGVFAMDYPGFGLSEGLHGYISSFDLLVEDVIEHFSNIKENSEFSSLPSFLFGQSMGGAVSLKIHFKQPNAWTGAVLVAPMCKIAEDMVPPPVLKHILIGLSSVLPKHKLVPQKDLTDAAFRDVTKRKLIDIFIKQGLIQQRDRSALVRVITMFSRWRTRSTSLITRRNLLLSMRGMFSAQNKIKKDKNAATTECDELVAQALFDLENTNQELKSDLKDLYINQAVNMDIAGNRKAVVIYVPFRLRKAFRKIHPRLVRELEKKFSGKDVIFVATRRIMRPPKKGAAVQRPRNRTLTSVHEAMLEDVAYPAEIVGKRTRYRLDGSKIMKVYLDTKERNNTEYKLETMIGVYRKLTGKDVTFEYPVEA
ncbi:unnamed protein product [Brassica napus]|nr:unnamed protein product [Brassica napus]